MRLIVIQQGQFLNDQEWCELWAEDDEDDGDNEYEEA